MVNPAKALDIHELVLGSCQAPRSVARALYSELISAGGHPPSIGYWGQMATGEEMHDLSAETLDAIVLERGFASMHERMESLERTIASAIGQVVALSARLQALEERLASQGVTRQAMVCDLGHEDYALKCPISVVVEEYDEETVARFPEVEAFASAATEGEALSLLKQEIVELYEDLLATDEDELGKLPRQWRRVLSHLIQKHGPPQR
jgi:hypothetical protein